jgi:uncharacterized cupredoxin-like copper-binding protein
MLLRNLPGAWLLLGVVITGCKSNRPANQQVAASPSDTAAASPATAPAAATVTVTATDFKFDLPAKVPAGAVSLRLVNNGKELHQAQIVRLEEGKTAADLAAAMKNEGAPPPKWAKFLGGPNGIAPGMEAESTTILAPGQYVILCLIPSPDGTPHIAKGMIHPMEVTATQAEAPLPAAGDTVRLVDYKFKASRPLAAGRRTILVVNDGPQPHELVLLKLSPGKSVDDFGKWATTGGMKGPPPAMPMGGVVVLDKGESGTFTADLTPGEYGFICFVPDSKDGKPHLAHGMMQQFKVS